MPFHNKIQEALNHYDKQKGILKRAGVRNDHPAIKAIKELSSEKQNDPFEILKCFFDTKNTVNATDKKHASFAVYTAVIEVICDYLQYQFIRNEEMTDADKKSLVTRAINMLEIHHLPLNEQNCKQLVSLLLREHSEELLKSFSRACDILNSAELCNQANLDLLFHALLSTERDVKYFLGTLEILHNAKLCTQENFNFFTIEHTCFEIYDKRRGKIGHCTAQRVVFDILNGLQSSGVLSQGWLDKLQATLSPQPFVFPEHRTHEQRWYAHYINSLSCWSTAELLTGENFIRIHTEREEHLDYFVTWLFRMPKQYHTQEFFNLLYDNTPEFLKKVFTVANLIEWETLYVWRIKYMVEEFREMLEDLDNVSLTEFFVPAFITVFMKDPKLFDQVVTDENFARIQAACRHDIPAFQKPTLAEVRTAIKAEMMAKNRQAQKAKVMALDRGGFFKHARGEHLPADTAEDIVDVLAGKQSKKPKE